MINLNLKRFEIDDPYLFVFIHEYGGNCYKSKIRLMTTAELTKLKEQNVYINISPLIEDNQIKDHITKIVNFPKYFKGIITVKPRDWLLNWTSSENGKSYLLNEIEEESFNKVLQRLGIN